MTEMQTPAAGGTATRAVRSKASNGCDPIPKTPTTQRHAGAMTIDKTHAHWVAKILKANGKSVGAIVQLGQTLIDAKQALDQHDKWLEIIEDDLPALWRESR